MIVLILIIIAIATEAISEIITSSYLTDSLRRRWKEFTYPEDQPPKDNTIQYIKVFIDTLISCGYCVSVWVSAILSLSVIFTSDRLNLINIPFLDWVICTFVTHRVSNWVHVIYELVRRGRVQTHDIAVRMNDVEE